MIQWAALKTSMGISQNALMPYSEGVTGDAPSGEVALSTPYIQHFEAHGPSAVRLGFQCSRFNELVVVPSLDEVYLYISLLVYLPL
jgi:hypothetical protein